MITLRLQYTDIYLGSAPEISSLLSQISFDKVALFVAKLNYQLFFHTDQIELLKSYTINVYKVNLIIDKLAEKNGSVIFSREINYHLLHYSAIYSKEKSEKIEFSVDDLLLIIEVILVLNGTLNEQNDTIGNFEKPYYYFRVNWWGLTMQQFVFQHWKNPLNNIIKGVILLDKIEQKYPVKYRKYLKYYNFEDKWKWLISIITPIYNCFNNEFEFVLEKNMISELFTNNLKFSLSNYKMEYLDSDKYFRGFRETPLYELPNGNFIVFDWNLLVDQLYNSLTFDFYNKTNLGIKFIDFKNEIRSQEVIENTIFSTCLKSIFPNKHKILKFDNDFSELKRLGSIPDAYLRFGNKIFLFEIKDAFFNSTVIQSGKYEEIKNEIDKKYNSDLKGVGQIIKQMEYFNYGNSFEDAQLNYSKFELYPVIIYTDEHFSLPGINRYLDEEFQKRIKEKRLESIFKKVQRLSFLPLDFFIANMAELSKTENRLDKLINKGFQKLKYKERNIGNTSTIDPINNLIYANHNLVDILYQLPNINRSDVKSMKLLEILDIVENNQRKL